MAGKLKAEQIIKIMRITPVSMTSRFYSLIKKYLKEGYPLELIESEKTLKPLIFDMIRDTDLVYHLKNYPIEDLARFNNTNYSKILYKLVENGNNSYSIILNFNLKNFENLESELSSLNEEELYELYLKTRSICFIDALTKRSIFNLLKFYSTTNIEDVVATQKILESIYGDTSTDFYFKIIKIKSCDIPYYVSLIKKYRNVTYIYETILLSSPRKEFEPFRSELLNLLCSIDDGRYCFALLNDSDIKLNHGDRNLLNETMSKCSSLEYRFYWMYYNRKADLKQIFQNATAMIVFLRSYMNNSIAVHIINELTELEKEEQAKYRDDLLNRKDPAFTFINKG